MFWLFPRHIARRVLTTWSEVVVPCQPRQRCCNLSVSGGTELTTGHGTLGHGRPRGEASVTAGTMPGVALEVAQHDRQHRAAGAEQEPLDEPLRHAFAPTSSAPMPYRMPYYDIPDSDRVPYSNWQRVYFGREAGFVPNHTALRGWGLVAANGRKRGRNCTLHVGCSPA